MMLSDTATSYSSEKNADKVGIDDALLDQKIAVFLNDYEGSFNSLMQALDEAQVSHYSSGFGMQRVTFDIFPASAYVKEFLTMLSLERPHRIKIFGGFKDASSKNDYNPGSELLQFMRRWLGFSEQVMRLEGDSE